MNNLVMGLWGVDIANRQTATNPAPRRKKRSGRGSLLARRLGGISRQRVSALKQSGKLKLSGGEINIQESVRMHAERLAAQTASPSRQVLFHFQAKLAKLTYEKAAGLLVEKAAVQRDAFKTGRQIRDGLLSFPDRLADLLAAECTGLDSQKVHAILNKEVRLLLLHLQTDPEEELDANAT